MQINFGKKNSLQKGNHDKVLPGMSFIMSIRIFLREFLKSSRTEKVETLETFFIPLSNISFSMSEVNK